MDHEVAKGCCQRTMNRSLPWTFRPIAWILVISIIVISALLIISYGIQFGDSKARKWLTSFVFSIIGGLLLTEPLKILFIALFCTCLFGRSNKENTEENEEQLLLQSGQEYVGFRTKMNKGDPHVETMAQDEIDEDRMRSLKEKKMWKLARTLISNIVFICILLIMAYGGRDPMAYHYKASLKHFYEGTWHENKAFHFRNVHSAEQFWDWADHVLVNATRAFWYTKQPPIDMPGMVMDKSSRVLGYGLIRQIRSKDEGACDVHSVVRHLFQYCAASSSLFTEDTTDYAPGWTLVGYDVSPEREYKYTPASELRGFVTQGRLGDYGAGGYVVPLFNHSTLLRPRLRELQTMGWVDNRTRAIFVETGMYNAPANLFANCFMILETTKAGAFMPTSRFEPVRLYRYSTDFAGMILLLTEVIFIVYIVAFLIQEILNAREDPRAYFTTFWSWVNMAILGFAGFSVLFYVLRWHETNNISSDVVETGGNVYIKLTLAALYEELFGLFQALILFFANVKILQLLQVNKRLSLIIETIRAAYNELIGFVVYFVIIYTAFTSAFFFMLSNKLYQFSTFLLTNQEAFSSLLGKFSFHAITKASALAPWFFFFFMLVQAIVLVNVLVTIVSTMFRLVKRDVSNQSSEYELINMLLGRLKEKVGMEKERSGARTITDSRIDTSKMDNLENRSDFLFGRLNRRFEDPLNPRVLRRAARRQYKAGRAEHGALVQQEKGRLDKEEGGRRKRRLGVIAQAGTSGQRSPGDRSKSRSPSHSPKK